MPKYQYRREDGTEFEQRQLMSDDALETCPDTGQEVERVITGGIDVQIKNKNKGMSEQQSEEKEARENKTTTLGEYANIAKRQEEKWEEKQRDKD